MEEIEEVVYGSPAYTKHCRKLYGNKRRFFSELPIGDYFTFDEFPDLENIEQPKMKTSDTSYTYPFSKSKYTYKQEPCMLVYKYFPK